VMELAREVARWVERADPRSGRTYWGNLDTKEYPGNHMGRASRSSQMAEHGQRANFHGGS